METPFRALSFGVTRKKKKKKASTPAPEPRKEPEAAIDERYEDDLRRVDELIEKYGLEHLREKK